MRKCDKAVLSRLSDIISSIRRLTSFLARNTLLVSPNHLDFPVYIAPGLLAPIVTSTVLNSNSVLPEGRLLAVILGTLGPTRDVMRFHGSQKRHGSFPVVPESCKRLCIEKEGCLSSSLISTHTIWDTQGFAFPIPTRRLARSRPRRKDLSYLPQVCRTLCSKEGVGEMVFLPYRVT